MKVAFFIPTLNIGGVEQTFVKLANALSLSGYDIDFVLCRVEGALLSQLSPGVNVVDLGGRKLRSSLWALRSYINTAQPNYMLTGSNVHNEFLILANSLSPYKTKVIISQRGFVDADLVDKPIYGKFAIPLMRYFYPKAFKVIAVSDGIEHFLQEINPQLPIVRIYNPFDILSIQGKALEVFPNTENLGQYLIFVGRLARVKNLIFLLKSFNAFKDDYPGIKLLIVGDGPESNSFKAKVAELDLTHRVIFVGEISNPYPYIKGASLLLLPSLSESFGNVVVEALSLGVTVVATPTIGVQEITEGDKYAYVSKDFTDEVSFSSLMRQAMKQPLAKEELQMRAEDFSMEKIITEYKLLLK